MRVMLSSMSILPTAHLDSYLQASHCLNLGTGGSRGGAWAVLLTLVLTAFILKQGRRARQPFTPHLLTPRVCFPQHLCLKQQYRGIVNTWRFLLNLIIFNQRIIALVLCWFLAYNKMNQPQIYTCPLPLESLSHPPAPHPIPPLQIVRMPG